MRKLFNAIRGRILYGPIPTVLNTDDPRHIFLKVTDLDNPNPDPPVYYTGVDTKAGTAVIYKRPLSGHNPQFETIKGRFKLEWDFT